MRLCTRLQPDCILHLVGKSQAYFFVGISLLYSKAISQDSIHTLSAPEKEMVPRSVFTESVLTDRIVTSGCRLYS